MERLSAAFPDDYVWCYLIPLYHHLKGERFKVKDQSKQVLSDLSTDGLDNCLKGYSNSNYVYLVLHSETPMTHTLAIVTRFCWCLLQ